MGQSPFKKHSKFQNFNEIFYCGMTRLRNTILNYCSLCRYLKPTKPKKVVRQSLFQNLLKFRNFNISSFLLQRGQMRVQTIGSI